MTIPINISHLGVKSEKMVHYLHCLHRNAFFQKVNAFFQKVNAFLKKVVHFFRWGATFPKVQIYSFQHSPLLSSSRRCPGNGWCKQCK